jgi:hypothetical protein
MLAVLGGLADVERDLIRTRTAEGRSRASISRLAHRQLGRGTRRTQLRAGYIIVRGDDTMIPLSLSDYSEPSPMPPDAAKAIKILTGVLEFYDGGPQLRHTAANRMAD